MSEYDTEMMPSYTSSSSSSSLLLDLNHLESEPQFSSPNEKVISANSPNHTQTMPSDFLPPISMTANHGPVNHLTYTSLPHASQSSFSRSSAFCTTLHVSTPTSSDTNRQLGIPFLPFLPNSIPTCTDNSVKFSMGGELIEQNCETTDFLEIGERSSDDRFEDFNYSDGSLALTEEEVGYLSDELHRAINASNEFPRIDEIYEEQCLQVPPTSTSFSGCDGNDDFPLEQKHDTDHPGINLEATSKTRIKWTSELHQFFLDAVNKLGGLEKATPKNVLLLMNVEGLNIYHIKSHLQKYRLTKKMQDLKQEHQASQSSEEKGSASTSKDGDAKRKRGMLITEALRMQIEFQKQLHEQLEVQKELQSRIEKQGAYLQEILEEQKKTGKTIPLQNSLVSSSNGTPSVEKAKDDIISCQQLKQKAVDYDETEQSKRQKVILLNDEETG